MLLVVAPFSTPAVPRNVTGYGLGNFPQCAGEMAGRHLVVDGLGCSWPGYLKLVQSLWKLACQGSHQP
ncbi:hypothetical protein METHP14_250036 [Pseudomonas sp. P14-2025]